VVLKETMFQYIKIIETDLHATFGAIVVKLEEDVALADAVRPGSRNE